MTSAVENGSASENLVPDKCDTRDSYELDNRNRTSLSLNHYSLCLGSAATRKLSHVIGHEPKPARCLAKLEHDPAFSGARHTGEKRLRDLKEELGLIDQTDILISEE